MDNLIAPNICDFLIKDAELDNIRQTLKRQGKVGIYGLSEGQRALIESALAQNRSMLLICLCCASFLLCAFAVVIAFKQGSNIKISAFDHGCVLIYATVYAECACVLIRRAVKANIVRLV